MEWCPHYPQGQGKFLGGGDSPAVLSANSYIQDGLVFQLDGIERGGVDGQWRDLAGGIVFDISGNTGGNQAVNVPPAIVNTAQHVIAPALDSTIETCFRRTNNVAAVNMFVDSNHNIGLKIDLSFTRFQLHASTTETDKVSYNIQGLSDLVLFSGSEAFALIAAKRLVRRYNAYTFPSGIQIGSSLNETNIWRGLIHSIRIYNRQLTEEEMLYNQRIDNIRFNLGLNLNGPITDYVAPAAGTQAVNPMSLDSVGEYSPEEVQELTEADFHPLPDADVQPVNPIGDVN